MNFVHFAGCCFLLIHWMDFQTSKSILVRIFTKIFPSHQTLAYSLPAIFGSNNMFYTSVVHWSPNLSTPTLVCVGFKLAEDLCYNHENVAGFYALRCTILQNFWTQEWNTAVNWIILVHNFLDYLLILLWNKGRLITV